jgi:hypothetical protein
MSFKKATKKGQKARIAIYGPSGSGKTFSALSIATGIGDKIAVIDTERGTASKYSDRFEFDVVDLDVRTIEKYIENIKEAGKLGYDVLIIDSLSHAWQELLMQIEKLAKAKYNGNTFRAWGEGTPEQHRLLDAILTSPCHIIVTMRSKTEYATETDDRGKVRPVKLGLAPEQGKGIEYEFDILMEINQEHFAFISKDRTGKYQDSSIEKPGKQFGKDLAIWLGEAEPIVASAEPKLQKLFEALDKIKTLDGLNNLSKKWDQADLSEFGDGKEVAKKGKEILQKKAESFLGQEVDDAVSIP